MDEDDLRKREQKRGYYGMPRPPSLLERLAHYMGVGDVVRTYERFIKDPISKVRHWYNYQRRNRK